MKIFTSMNRLIQLIQLIFVGKILNAKQHYGNEKIVHFYREFNSQGLFEDELEVVSDLLKRSPSFTRMLMIGAGTGRECLALSSLFQEITAFEPVKDMINFSSEIPNCTWIQDLAEISGKKYDVIWLTKYLPSLLMEGERTNMYQDLAPFCHPETVVILKPDIMPLSWSETFRFKLASIILKYRILKNQWQEGDTVRQNLDFNFVADKLVYYHYFQSVEKCIEDIQNKLPLQQINYSLYPLGFIKIKLS